VGIPELTPVFVAFAASAAGLRLLLAPRVTAWFLDHPNERSLHAAPVPRTGGLGIMPPLLAAILLVGGNGLLVALAFGLMLLSLLDDWRDLPAGVRLSGHLCASGVFVLAFFPAANWIALLLLVLAVGWMINLYNFMDGADGLAGGMTILGFCTYAAAAWLAGNLALCVTNLCVAASAGAFLLFNFPPARLFMGDAGSVPLGLMAAALGLLGWRDGIWPLWFPLVAFAPFVLDASITLLRRAIRGERVWQAHRSHFYQRLVLTGWSHRRLAVAEYGLMLMSGGAALLALRQPFRLQLLILTALAVVYILSGLAVDRRWRASQRMRSSD
jgi:UDP-N-acetylmuramyl pentapeptide phosphotransferase/UDP-N-acetylglucosamine-1-phosphate transferase